MSSQSPQNKTNQRLAGGFLLGTALGLTPVFSLHNLLVLALLPVVRVSYRAFIAGWLLFIPVGFLLDPVFDWLGRSLLTAPVLRSLWITASNAPLVPLTSFNNTVTLGSLIFWIAMWVPIYLVMKKVFGVYGELVERTLSGLPLLGRIGGSQIVKRIFGIHAGSGWVRKGFVVPMGSFLLLSIASWWLFADRGARIALERGSTQIVGATVDVASADLDLSDGTFGFMGLQVTDPAAPENNMIEVGSLSAAISTSALLSSRIAIDSVMVDDIRFNTLRSSPGKVDTSREQSSFFRDQMNNWKASVAVPRIPTPDLTGLVDLAALDVDSFATVLRARQITASSADARVEFGNRLAAINPAVKIDSARSVLSGLEGATISSLGVSGTVGTVASLRSVIAELDDGISSMNILRVDLAAKMSESQGELLALQGLREGDYRRALGSLNLPSMNPDDLSASVLQTPLMQRVETLLYWINQIDSYLPQEREHSSLLGPMRARASGSDIIFPSGESRPLFSMRKLRGTASLGDLSGFTAEIFDLSTNPQLTGRPTLVQLTGSSGLSQATVEVEIDRTSGSPKDQLRARLVQFPLPSLNIPALAARLDLGDGTTNVALSRAGDSLSGIVVWSTTNASWVRDGADALPAGTAFFWETISKLASVEITLGLSGTLTSPGISVRSNIGNQAARAMASQMGDELRRAEGRVRGEVDRLIEEPLLNARNSLSDLENNLGSSLGDYEEELDLLKAQLESRVRQLTPRIPGIGR